MSDFQHTDMFGALHRNQYKRADNQPDYKGDATVRGQAVEIGGWLKTDKNGKKYLSLKFSEPHQGGGGNQAVAAPSGESSQTYYDSPAGEVPDSEIPF